MLVLFSEVRVEAHCDEGRHVERLPDVGAAAADEGATCPMPGLPGDGSEAGEGSGLALPERAEFWHVDEERAGGERRDARDADEDGEAARQLGIGPDERHDLLFDHGHLTCDLPELDTRKNPRAFDAVVIQ